MAIGQKSIQLWPLDLSSGERHRNMKLLYNIFFTEIHVYPGFILDIIGAYDILCYLSHHAYITLFFKQELQPKPKLNMFCTLPQNNEHLFLKNNMTIFNESNCLRKSKMVFNFQ